MDARVPSSSREARRKPTSTRKPTRCPSPYTKSGKAEHGSVEVNGDTSGRFHYIQIPHEGRPLFCLQQSLGVLAWILYFRRGVFDPIERAVPQSLSFKVLLSRLRRFVGLLRKHARSLLVFALYKYQWRNVDRVVELPRYGQWCLPVHQGHKIFDLRRRVAIKVFDHDVPTSIALGEIDLLKRVSQLEFAPSLNNWDVAGKWYEEEFLEGALDASSTPMDSVTLLNKFQDEIARILNRLVLFQDPATQNALEYVNGLIQQSNFRRLSGRESTAGHVDAIQNFFADIVEWLREEAHGSIYLVFTHGDFVPANMLNARQGIKIIDWEGCGFRSALYDFYSYLFYRPVSRNVPVHIIVPEIDKALPILLTRLSKTAPDIATSIRQCGKAYRLTFYIEMLCRLLTREMSDRNLNIMKYISGYIDAFTEFEKLSTHECALDASESNSCQCM